MRHPRGGEVLEDDPAAVVAHRAARFGCGVEQFAEVGKELCLGGLAAVAAAVVGLQCEVAAALVHDADVALVARNDGRQPAAHRFERRAGRADEDVRRREEGGRVGAQPRREDARRRADGSGWNVYKNGGRIDTGLDAIEWAVKANELGAGEILLTSMDCDGTKDGYDIELTRLIADNVSVPVIASGGAGTKEHFYEALTEGKADAALAASLFHYKELEIMDLKNYLADKGVSVRR